MRFIWHSPKKQEMRKVHWYESQTLAGVRFSIRSVSLGSRLELLKALRELITQNEFLRNGDSLQQTDAAISDLLAQSLYLRWGLRDVEGLSINGQPATPESVVEYAPERLCREIVDVIRESLELSETERKNY